ncbi:MAG: hypothetical protein M1838_002687 [Thelocarpon superellum]|nr:MAG: hypothetical protein M1838_002687 [Thelocarpon superellum]
MDMDHAAVPAPGPVFRPQARPVKHASYAFLVHSQETLPRNLPPNVDNKPLARQKRRRTSPEDQVILEEEYQRNAKPDKSARMHIVQRVALGEKEVQIWFQNRRQNTRRKSKPLEAHELAPIRSSEPSSSDGNPHPSRTHIDAQEGSVSETASSTQGSASHDASSRGATTTPLSSQSSVARDVTVSQDNSHESSRRASFPLSQASHVLSLTDRGGTPSHSLPHVRHSLPGYISNRRNASTLGQHESVGHDGLVAHAPALLKRSSSLIRLSMSLDGKAQVVTDEEEAQAATAVIGSGRTGGFQRSQSLVHSGEVVAVGAEGSSSRRPPSGRSQDSRAWEFYCDSDTRNSLSAKAEEDRKGSALGAIGLLRSQSINPLVASKHKFNAQPAAESSAKRTKISGSQTARKKLTRASSSFARLQGSESERPQKISTKVSTKVAPLSQPSPSGDSDKENWVPGTQQPEARRPEQPTCALKSRAQKEILKENLSFERHRVERGTATGLVASGSPPDASTWSPKVDRGASGRAGGFAICEDVSLAARGGEDLDCVQNLLSLSQGNWR